ncbi:hypothetical protein V9T40_009152 [Parthenolecanium corni]|uniref:Uncharacterized protein n=1 Tax=Parthenolecanium corni TaxID=536013 RepID=A0AAN9TRS0_9HEMI
MFGTPARVGLERTGLPADLCHLLQEEDNLEDALQGLVPSDRSDDSSEEDDVTPQSPSALLAVRHEAIASERAAAKAGLVQQAKRMKRDSDAKFPPPDLGTKSRRLKQLYARSQFTVSAEKFIDKCDVPDKTIPLRSAAIQHSVEAGGHGQGFQRCNCTMACTTNACSCRQKGVLCNSKCHHTSSCANK